MVAAPFLALMFAIMETALVFFAGQALETAVADQRASDHDRPGADAGLQPGRSSRTRCAPRSTACSIAPSGLYVDVKTYSSFAVDQHCASRSTQRQPADRNFGYQPGGPGDIVVVRLMYQWPVYVSLLGFNLADMAGSKRLLMATVAFRNEPYQWMRSRHERRSALVDRDRAPAAAPPRCATSAASRRSSSRCCCR